MSIYVTRPSMPDFEEYVEEIRDLWDSHWITNMGQKHEELTERLRQYLGVERLSLFVNGHMALELAIQAMNLNGEVITTPFTFASTTHAIVRNKLKPVFCDIDPVDYTMDVGKLEQLITDQTSAILPVHIYGNICNVERIEEIAGKYGLKVIYDAAHAFGETYKGAGVGSFGDASMFSFHATKVFNTIEGGAVAFSEKSYGDELYRLKDFGIQSEELVDKVGANAKMNEFQAAMGLCNLRHVDAEIQKRRKLYEQYEDNLNGVEGLQLRRRNADVSSNYAYMPVVIDERKFGRSRNQVYGALREKGIYTRKYFYPITNDFDCYRGSYDTRETPVALHVSKRVLTLPLYAELTAEEVDWICREIKALKG